MNKVKCVHSATEEDLDFGEICSIYNAEENQKILIMVNLLCSFYLQSFELRAAFWYITLVLVWNLQCYEFQLNVVLIVKSRQNLYHCDFWVKS